MPVTVNIRSKSSMGTIQKVLGTMVFSGNYPASGEPLPWGSLASVTTKPLSALIVGSAQNNKYYYDDVNQKVVVRSGAAPPVEVTAGAYPASVTSDVINFDFTFDKY